MVNRKERGGWIKYSAMMSQADKLAMKQGSDVVSVHSVRSWMCWPAAAGRNLKYCLARCLLTIGQSSVFEIKWFWIEELSKSENRYSVNTCGLWEAFMLSALSVFKKVLLLC